MRKVFLDIYSKDRNVDQKIANEDRTKILLREQLIIIQYSSFHRKSCDWAIQILRSTPPPH